MNKKTYAKGLLVVIAVFSGFLSLSAVRDFSKVFAASSNYGPDLVTAYPLSNTSIVIKWADSTSITDPATSFVIERSTNGTTFTNPQTLPATTRNFTYTGLTANTIYYFRVKAITQSGASTGFGTVNSRTSGYLIDVKQVDGGAGSLNALKISTNASGERVILGTFTGNATIAPGITLNPTEGGYFVAKFNSLNQAVWAKSFAPSTQIVDGDGIILSSSVNQAIDVAISPSGVVAVAGNVIDTTFNDPDISEDDVVVTKVYGAKYNANGTQAWIKYETDGGDPDFDTVFITARSVAINNFGEVYVVGTNVGGDNGFGDGSNFTSGFFFTIVSDGTVTNKSSIPGVVVYQSGTTNRVKQAGAVDVAVNSLNNIFVAGNKTHQQISVGNGDFIRYDAFLHKYPVPVWTNVYSGQYNSEARSYSVAVDPNNNPLLLNDRDANNGSGGQMFNKYLYKLSPSTGTPLSGFPILLNSHISSFDNTKVFADSSSNIFVVRGGGADDIEKRIIKFNSNGGLLWSKLGGVVQVPPFAFSDAASVQNDLLLAGTVDGLHSIDQVTLQSDDKSDMFIARFSDTGTFPTIDNTPPASSAVSILCNSGTGCSNVSVTASSTETVAGSRMRFSTDGSNWSAPQEFTPTLNYNIGSAPKLYAQFSDGLHNWSGTVESNTKSSGALPGTYEYWVDNNPNFTASEKLDQGVSGPNANPDGDSMVNLLEYGFVKNPKQNDASDYSFFLMNSRFTLKYRMNTSATDLVYKITSTPTLGTIDLPPVWEEDVFDVLDATTIASGVDEVTATDQETLAQLGRMRFFRLEVDKTTPPELPPAPLSLNANFGTQYTSFKVVSNGKGKVLSSMGIDCGEKCFKQLAPGTSVSLDADPEKGYFLESWGGSCSGNTRGCTFTVSASTTVIANFSTIPDVTAPTIYKPSPQGTVRSATNVTFWTQENAFCRYGGTANMSYDNMKDVYQIPTAGVQHSFNPGPHANGLHNYYLKCKDIAGNINPTDYVLSFTVQP